MEGCLVLTSNTDKKMRVVETIIELLVSLYAFGFYKPQVSIGEWSTTLTLMLSEIALEIEIDWRDFDIFVLVVRLENGKMPSGYYVSQGRPCRYHLQKIIAEQNWNVDQESLSMILPGKKGKRQNTNRTEEGLLERFRLYKKVLDGCVENLVKEGEAVF